MKTHNLFFVVLLSVLMSACTGFNKVASQAEFKQSIHQPIIIAHRGASGYLPEHTKEAAVLAFMQGADYIEQDLVLTKDDHLVVLHDIHLETVTNVESIFPERARSDNRFYAIDFSLSELRLLSLHERETDKKSRVFPNRYNGSAHFSISTFTEHVELLRELNRQLSKNIGWYVEIKSPQWHLEEGKDIVKALSDELNKLALNNIDSNIYVQSFEPSSLQRLKTEHNIKVPLIQLIADDSWNESDANYAQMLSSEGLKKIASYAQGIGPWLPQIYNYEKNTINSVISIAKQAGLLVHPYTHREDARGLPDEPQAMFELLKESGIDGLFTDQIMPYMKTR